MIRQVGMRLWSSHLQKKSTGWTSISLLLARGSVSTSMWSKSLIAERHYLDKKTSDPVFYVDIKSERLRDILRTVLQDVHGVSLREDKPQVWFSVFLHKSLT